MKFNIRLNYPHQKIYKKSQKRISISDSKSMRDNLHKDLNDYKITFKGFSLEDIVVFLSKH